MKMLRILIVLAVISFASCKSKDKTSKTTGSTTTTTTTSVTGSNSTSVSSGTTTGSTSTNNTGTNQSVQDNMRLVVSFISIGEGIDYKTKEKYDGFIGSQAQKPKYDEAHWGREGEVDYCFPLSEMSKQEQDNFVAKTKEMLGGNKLVIISENSPCTHKK